MSSNSPIEEFLRLCSSVGDLSAALVLRRGRAWQWQPYCEELWGARGPRGECFKNAWDLASSHSELRYVEGWALSCCIPLQHAWCVDQDDRVVDPTWRDPDAGGEWFGMEFELELLTRAQIDKRTYGILDWRGLYEPELA